MRFLENHDEPRAAAVFPPEVQRAAAVVTYLAPGLRLFHEGQLEGRQSHVSMHVGRRRAEAPVPTIADFYGRLLQTLRGGILHAGELSLHGCRPAWDGNATFHGFVVFSWRHETARLLVAVNFSAVQAQCYVDLAWADVAGRSVTFTDALSAARYERPGAELLERGLYLDMPPWGYHVFDCRAQL